jgi:hypothetical protein
VVNATGDGQQRVDRRVEWVQRVDCADDAPSGAAIAGVVDHRLDGIARAANVSGRGPSSIPRSGAIAIESDAGAEFGHATGVAPLVFGEDRYGNDGTPGLSSPSTDP